MNYTEDSIIIIPSLNPDHKFINLLIELKNAEFKNIVIVDDGSNLESKSCFQQAKEEYGCHIITHCVNMGKGRALKTGFNYILNKFPTCIGAVTVDSDGQHDINDIIKCAKELSNHPNSLIMGCRNFANNNIPFTNKAGNIITRKIMNVLCGIKLSDTQTGLRGIPNTLMSKLLNVKGERFEYEMNMLVNAKENHISIIEVPIQAIYIENNQTSHFHPFLDSFQVYTVFIKFLFSSLSSFVIDITFFSLLILIFKSIIPVYYILLCTIGARIFSSIYNFIFNKNNVFKDASNSPIIFVKYFSLCVIQLLVSAFFVNLIFNHLFINEAVIKTVIDCILFFISFKIQQNWIFNRNKEANI